MRINIVLPTFGQKAGGVGTVASAHLEALGKQDNCLPSVLHISGYETFETAHPVSGFRGFGGLSPGLALNLARDRHSVCHLHGVWHPISASTLIPRLALRIPTVISPHGMLEEWILNRGQAKKRIAKLFYEKYSWHQANAFHALTEKEVDDIRRVVTRPKSIFLIPNWVEDTEASAKTVSGAKNFLFIGRFHEKKGLAQLCEAWHSFVGQHPDCSLTVVGWGDEFHFGECWKHESIRISGPVFDQEEKNRLYRDADITILPSFSEGLPMVVLESWAQGTPVIMTNECNLRIGFDHDCAIEVTPEAKSIMDGLLDATSLSSTAYTAMSEASLQLARSAFSASTVVHKLVRMYRWVRGEEVDVSDIKVQ